MWSKVSYSPFYLPIIHTLCSLWRGKTHLRVHVLEGEYSFFSYFIKMTVVVVSEVHSCLQSWIWVWCRDRQYREQKGCPLLLVKISSHLSLCTYKHVYQHIWILIKHTIGLWINSSPLILSINMYTFLPIEYILWARTAHVNCLKTLFWVSFPPIFSSFLF